MGWATLSDHANRVAQRRLGAVPFLCNGVSGEGFLKQNAETIFGGEMVIIRWSLTALTADVENFSYGDEISIAGRVHRVEVQPQPFDDGTWSTVPLSDPITITPPPVTILLLTTTTGVELTTSTGIPLVAI